MGPENLCKVADFGLAQSGGSSGLVIVEEQLKLPVRWLAPEAITTRKFSEYSDCWAFGVTVWEIFSCKKTPYAVLLFAVRVLEVTARCTYLRDHP